jgi:hypothetical protein
VYLVNCGLSPLFGSTRYIRRTIRCGYNRALSTLTYRRRICAFQHYVITSNCFCIHRATCSTSNKCCVAVYPVKSSATPLYPSSSRDDIRPSQHIRGHGQATGSPGTPFELPLPSVQPKYDMSKMGLLEGGIEMKIC